MAMIFSNVAVAAAALLGDKAVPGPSALGLPAGVCAVVDEAELGVLATSEGAEAGGDAP